MPDSLLIWPIVNHEATERERYEGGSLTDKGTIGFGYAKGVAAIFARVRNHGFGYGLIDQGRKKPRGVFDSFNFGHEDLQHFGLKRGAGLKSRGRVGFSGKELVCYDNRASCIDAPSLTVSQGAKPLSAPAPGLSSWRSAVLMKCSEFPGIHGRSGGLRRVSRIRSCC